MKYLRWLLFPFSLIYGLVVVMRNWCYDAGLFQSRSYNAPVICVGNLNVGGAGKSPMTEYLVRLLKDQYKLATLSRGYGRRSKGFVLATTTSTAADLGDEPAQFTQKYPDITVAVCEKRTDGIDQLLPQHEVVVLDDAYQHRAVKPGFSILLFDHGRINDPHLLLPAGNLREPFIGRYRADVMVVSKCPVDLSPAQQQRALEILRPLGDQQVFFTTISYLPLQDMNGAPVGPMPVAGSTVFLLTGIANAEPLVNYLEQQGLQVVHHNYPDHHQFTPKNIAKLASEHDNSTASNKVIITTEKDAQRLRQPELLSHIQALPIWVLPIGIRFLNDAEKQFDQIIESYVRKY